MTANSSSATEPAKPAAVETSNSKNDTQAQTRPLTLPQAAPLPASQLALIKATVPVLQQHGEAITREMYNTLISAHPDLRNIFSSTSQTTGRQPRALANAVLGYATYIDDLPKLQHTVERIAQKHVSLFVQPEQYAVVGEYLIGAIKTVLGDAATDEIVEAWTAAYGVLASVFVSREGELYAADGEWKGWREFRIAKRVREAEGIVSFWLEPVGVDGANKLPGFLPGQYISLQVDVPSLGYKQSRQFSLSNFGSEQEDGQELQYYRISVKKEESGAVVSNLLHDSYHEGDIVGVSPPHGEFWLDPHDKSKEGQPVVLISAGVGATPLVSMLKALSASSLTEVKRPISWIHTSRSRDTAPFREEVDSTVQALREKGVDVVTRWHLREDEGKRLDLAIARDGDGLFVKDSRAEYFVCGPEEFMVQTRRALVETFGVEKGRVFLELFATGDVVDDC